jgi:predicted DNA-binding transcriptional regulator AlpA
MNTPMKKYLTLRELRERDGVANSTRYQWIADGKYPAGIKFGPKQTRWSIEEVEAAEAERMAARKHEAV